APEIDAAAALLTRPPASRSAPASLIPVPLILPALASVPAAPVKATPAVAPEIEAPERFVTLPPPARRAPNVVPTIVPLFATVPDPLTMNTPAAEGSGPNPGPDEIDAPAALVTAPPANSATPSSTVAAMLPALATDPIAPAILTP